MPPYELVPAAQNDLKEIARYTLKQWGKAQSIHYATQLEKCFLEIAARSRLSCRVLERYPSLEVSRCEHHYVFYLHPEDQLPQTITVLHEKMDMLERLRNRLP